MSGMLLNMLSKLPPGTLPKLLIERPELLIDHAMAYVDLAKSEIEAAKQDFLRRFVATAVALMSALCFVMLSGVALMLCASSPTAREPIWMFLTVPGVMLLIAAASSVVALSNRKPPLQSLSAQLQLDLSVFRVAMQLRP
jgi:Putative Actinobacterial Holin-X, holin superfamily III